MNYRDDHRFSDDENMFGTKVFYGVMDIVIVQLTSRFEGMNGIASKFSFLLPRNLITLSNTELIEKTTALQQYNSDISDSVPMQVVLLVSVLRREIEKIETIRELAD